MRVLEFSDLDTTRVKAAYAKVKAALERDDFRSAEVKKLGSAGGAKLYRARLDHSNRLHFTLVRHRDEVCALALEVVLNHAYDRSRFLRGARIDDDKIPALEGVPSPSEVEVVRYLHPRRSVVGMLDKVISFDDAQDALYRMAPPVVVVGSAGSGKTALTLEKVKQVEGEVLYVTLSAYLAQSARDLYYAHGFERDGQEVSFLSYRELVETIRVPSGREATWREFSGWFSRMRQAFRGLEAHQVFEEIRGVIASDGAGILERQDYRELGVRQSIFLTDQRDALYDLFLKYRGWLSDAGLYDLNLVAHDWRSIARPTYDFVVVDEVQDLTSVQLALVLSTLKKPGQFLLCGDSNQIVHPNFFSWAKIKALFWQNPELAEHQTLQVLTTNFRNAGEVTRVANALLRIKQSRFGSIDKESNFLVTAVSPEPGTVTLLSDKDAVKRDLDDKTRGSTQFAVLVLRDEDKSEAAKHFKTPLIFSVHEAKGLEYDNIVLYRFVSGHRQEYREIADGVTPEDLASPTLAYRRAADKTDKSLEIYKFYVNALYVALTRAIKNVYLIESDTGHTLFVLLGLGTSNGKLQVVAGESSLEDWQKEARKLELQGKLEQADAIRKNVLKQAPVPWPVFDRNRLHEALHKTFVERVPSPKFRHLLFEFAACYDMPSLAGYLYRCFAYQAAQDTKTQFSLVQRKHFSRYQVGPQASQFREILKECDRHGLDHRTPMNLTPLITATLCGNVPLVEVLLERGASLEATDIFGRNAFHWALLRSFEEEEFAIEVLPALYERLAPPSVDVKVGERLVRIDRHLSEYHLLQTMWALFLSKMVHRGYTSAAYDTESVLAAYDLLPPSVLREQRRKRAFISAVLSRNEVNRDYAYNRRLFLRVRQGLYVFNPRLAVRSRVGDEERWTPIYAAMDLAMIKEICEPWHWSMIDFLLGESGSASSGTPMAGAMLLPTLGR